MCYEIDTEECILAFLSYAKTKKNIHIVSLSVFYIFWEKLREESENDMYMDISFDTISAISHKRNNLFDLDMSKSSFVSTKIIENYNNDFIDRYILSNEKIRCSFSKAFERAMSCQEHSSNV